MMNREDNELKVLASIESIIKGKEVKLVSEDNKHFIKGDTFKLYFSVDTFSENAIIWDKLEFSTIINYEEFNKQFSSNTKKLIYDIMKEIEESGIVVQPF